MRQLTIHSDGYGGQGTVILDEDGNKIEGVFSATIYMEANRINEVTLEVQAAKTVVKATLKEVNFICPLCEDRVEHKCEEELGGNTNFLKDCPDHPGTGATLAGQCPMCGRDLTK